MAGSLSSSNKLIGGKKILEPFNYMIKQIVVTELMRRFLFSSHNDDRRLNRKPKSSFRFPLEKIITWATVVPHNLAAY